MGQHSSFATSTDRAEGHTSPVRSYTGEVLDSQSHELGSSALEASDLRRWSFVLRDGQIRTWTFEEVASCTDRDTAMCRRRGLPSYPLPTGTRTVQFALSLRTTGETRTRGRQRR